MAPIREDALRIWNTKTRLWVFAIILSCFISSNFARAEPEPGPYYVDNLSGDPESMRLIQRLRQLAQQEREINEKEREIADETLTIEGFLEAKAEGMGIAHYSQKELEEAGIGEPLPVPSAQRSQSRYEKRGSYMALCHFKICNMGRKRQL